MPKKSIKKMTREDYEEKIAEMEAQNNEDLILRDTISYRRELLTVLNRIAEAVENSGQAGDEPDEKLLPEIPEPEPIPNDDEGDF